MYKIKQKRTKHNNNIYMYIYNDKKNETKRIWKNVINEKDITSKLHMIYIKKVKWSRYRPGVAQRVGRGIGLLFHDRGTRRGCVVSSTPRPHFTPGKDPVPILQEAGWAPGPVWTVGKSRPHRNSIPDRSAHSQSLYRLNYLAHHMIYIYIYIYISCNDGRHTVTKTFTTLIVW